MITSTWIDLPQAETSLTVIVLISSENEDCLLAAFTGTAGKICSNSAKEMNTHNSDFEIFLHDENKLFIFSPSQIIRTIHAMLSNLYYYYIESQAFIYIL